MKKKSLKILKKAKKQLGKVPSNQWHTDIFTNNNDSCCAIGHFTRLNSKDPSDFSMDNCKPNNDTLREASNEAMQCINGNGGGHDISTVNNDIGSGSLEAYSEEEPKDRVMHFLDDAIKCLSK